MALHLNAFRMTAILSGLIFVATVDASGCAFGSRNPPQHPPLILPSAEIDGLSPAETSLNDFELDNLLTQNLEDDGLPGVGVHVWTDGMGNGSVILYGFVDSETQRREAEEQAREISSGICFAVNDRLRIRPTSLTG